MLCLLKVGQGDGILAAHCLGGRQVLETGTEDEPQSILLSLCGGFLFGGEIGAGDGGCVESGARISGCSQKVFVFTSLTSESPTSGSFNAVRAFERTCNCARYSPNWLDASFSSFGCSNSKVFFAASSLSLSV